MKLTRRHGLYAGAAIAAGLLAWSVLRPEALPVDVAAAERGALQVTVDEEGETRVLERFVVAAPTQGRLLRIAFEEGDPIQVGQVLAHIQPVPLGPRAHASARAALDAAEATKRAADAEVALSKAALAQAARSLERADQLLERGTLSDETHEQTRLSHTRARQEYEAALFAAKAADHDVDAARAALLAATTPTAEGPGLDGLCSDEAPCFEVRAPVTGQVLRVVQESERIVGAGEPLLEVGDPAKLEIVVDVLSTDAVRIRPGTPIWIEDWGGEKPLKARVRRVEPSGFTKLSALGVEEQRVNVIGDFVDPPAGLGDGYRVEARIVVWESEEVLRVPASALFRTGEAWTVFVVDGGVARLREVDLGHRGAYLVEIETGLEPGESVVLHPSDRLADGVRVRPL